MFVTTLHTLPDYCYACQLHSLALITYYVSLHVTPSVYTDKHSVFRHSVLYIIVMHPTKYSLNQTISCTTMDH